MVTVPAVRAVTLPVAGFTEAMDALLLLQLPPVPVVVKVADVPAHNGDVPLMVPASGALLTVTALVAVAVPQLLVTA